MLFGFPCKGCYKLGFRERSYSGFRGSVPFFGPGGIIYVCFVKCALNLVVPLSDTVDGQNLAPPAHAYFKRVRHQSPHPLLNIGSRDCLSGARFRGGHWHKSGLQPNAKKGALGIMK